MDTLFSLKVFCEIAEQGSFTRAAERLHISTAMASKHIQHLEKQVQTKLLLRNSRHVHLTEAGRQYYRHCSHALDTLSQAAEQAADHTNKPQGLLRITMPLWFANARVSAWLTEYRERYPEVTLDLILNNHHNDLAAEGIDLALRVAAAPGPSLIVRPLGDIRFYLVASPSYVARHGMPEQPQQLAQYHAVLPSYIHINPLSINTPQGESVALTLSSVVSSDNTLMNYHLVKTGAGIGVLPEPIIAGDLADGSLVQLLPECRIAPSTLYAAYVNRNFLSRKVRSFIDFLLEKNAESDTVSR